MFKIADITQDDVKVGKLLIKVILPYTSLNEEYFSRYNFMIYIQNSIVDGYPIFVIRNFVTLLREEKINKITGRDSTSGFIDFFEDHYGILEKKQLIP